ncbi:hypothetical protein PG985_012765 [Apiospora marii]|uniref:uncharacterized protein n=1 Tax=Apiospora marii TaxID=335849 RepID=UPI003131AC4C
MSDSDYDSDDFNWDEPLPDQMKHTLAIIEKLTGDFSMTKWKQIAAATGMSLATAKHASWFSRQRYGRLRDKYLAEMPSLQEDRNNPSNADGGGNEEAPGPRAARPLPEAGSAPLLATRRTLRMTARMSPPTLRPTGLSTRESSAPLLTTSKRETEQEQEQDGSEEDKD